ncbi:MAG: lipopolysaccharide transport periplasmic protein LptA [Pseudomonadota bacterium]
MFHFRAFTLALLLSLSSTLAGAQSANIAVGTGAFDASSPVEVTADEFTVDQSNGRAVFDGNVLVVQGAVRLAAGRVTIEYEEGTSTGISRLLASGGVTFVTSTDAAEASDAVYSVSDSIVTLSGDVILTQGQSTIAGDRLVVDLGSGDGRMEGRVRTVFTPADGNN